MVFGIDLTHEFQLIRYQEQYLLNLKETKSMTSNSPQEMRRVLEKIKNYARQSKEANNAADLSYSTLDLIEQKLTDNLLRRYRRWLHQEHQKELPNVDHLISFLQSETELEERISIKTSQNASRKTKPIINVINSATQDHCLLCKVSRHKFVDCDELKKLSPQEQTNAIKRLHRCFTCLAPMHREPKTCRYRCRCLTFRNHIIAC